MRIKHYQGYGNVTAVKIKDSSCTLHVKVSGDHEYGLETNDEYTLYKWLIEKFDKNIESAAKWHQMRPRIQVIPTYVDGHEYCDYKFTYDINI